MDDSGSECSYDDEGKEETVEGKQIWAKFIRSFF